MNRAVEGIGAVVSVLVGLALLGVGGYLYWDQTTALDRAVAVDATVLDSAVVEHVDDERGVDYYPGITYQYVVGGVTYTADTTYPGFERAGAPERVTALVERFPVGATVTAYVDPDEPARAFLVAERDLLFPVAFGLGGVVFVARGVFGRRLGLTGFERTTTAVRRF